MNFIIDNGHLILQLYSWQGYLLLFYLFGEISSFYFLGMSFIHRLLLIPRIIFQVNKIKPKHWKFNHRYVYQFLFMKRKSHNRYDVWMDLYAAFYPKKYPSYHPEFTWHYQIVTHCVTNRWGKIIESDLEDEISRRDTILKDKIKVWNREQQLKKIGL